MTQHEAIEILAQIYDSGVIPLNADPAFKMAIKAIKKQTPIQHHHTRIDNINDSIRVSACPDCLGLIYTFKDEYPNFCTQCGQKIDWKE